MRQRLPQLGRTEAHAAVFQLFYLAVHIVEHRLHVAGGLFGDLNQHGPDSIRFYTKTKTVTSRWPSGVKEGAEFSIPLME